MLVDARQKLRIPWGNPSNQRHGDTMMAFDTRSLMAHGHGMVEPKVFLHYLPSIRALWADQGIQNAYDRRREFQLVSQCQSAARSTRHHREGSEPGLRMNTHVFVFPPHQQPATNQQH